MSRRGEAVQEGEGWSVAERDVVIGHQRLALTEAVFAQRPALRRFDGRDVVVGIRPESVAQSPNGPVAGRTLELDVPLTEALGSDLLVHADVDAPVRAGERVRAVIDVERLHVFDPETERAIR